MFCLQYGTGEEAKPAGQAGFMGKLKASFRKKSREGGEQKKEEVG